MHRLKLELRQLPPEEWPDEPVSPDFYAEIQLSIRSPEGTFVQTVFSIKWNAAPLLEWICNNKDYILHEHFPASLAEMVAAFQAAENISDRCMDEIYAYRTRHGLRFALRGVDIPDAYLGRTTLGYEISCADDDGTWSYLIDLGAFFKEVASEYPPSWPLRPASSSGDSQGHN
jgi:hypothetical protein